MRAKKIEGNLHKGVYPRKVESFDFGRFAEDIKAWRNRERLPGRIIGGLLGVSHVTVSNWETRKSMPQMHNFLDICALMNLDPFDYWIDCHNLIHQLKMKLN